MPVETLSSVPPANLLSGLDDRDWDHSLLVSAFDPGGTTGWCVLDIDAEALKEGWNAVARDRRVRWTCGQFGGSERDMTDAMVRLCREVWALWAAGEGDGWVVPIEDFILYRSESDRSLLSPVRVTARFEDRMRAVGLPVVKYSSRDALGVISDERLQFWGLFSRFSGVHARDATRHAVLAARKWASNERGMREWLEQKNDDMRALAS